MMDERNTHTPTSNNQAESPARGVTELIDIVDQNIASIVDLHMRAEQHVSRHQRLMERVTAILGRPRSFYLIVLFVALWMAANLLLAHFGLSSFDTPPFSWLQAIVALSALLLTTVVLITQNRQGKLAEQRMHLDLQVSLLIEQKVTKLIDLVEQLRRDTPIVHDRHDPQADAMKEPVNPHQVIKNLNQTLEETIRE